MSTGGGGGQKRPAPSSSSSGGGGGGGGGGVVGGLSSLLSKKSREEQRHASSSAPSHSSASKPTANNPFLTRPDKPEKLLALFLLQSRTEARRAAPNGTLPATQPYCEIEARIGILKSPFGAHEMRVASSGPKRSKNGTVASAFLVSAGDEGSVGGGAGGGRPHFEGGITRSHFVHWTGGGLSEAGPISAAFGVRSGGGGSGGSHEAPSSAAIKKEIVETEMIETVYGGYRDDNRIAFPGEHHVGDVRGSDPAKLGRMERKTKLTGMDVALPAAPYDLRLQLATEKVVDEAVRTVPPGWSTKRIKRRRSYVRRDKSFAWRMDVTEVTSAESSVVTAGTGVTYEIELELSAGTTLRLINEDDADAAQKLCWQLAQQAWWMLDQINPAHEVLDVEEYLREHPDREATKLALAQCGALKRFVDSGGRSWESPIVRGGGTSPTPPASLYNIKFMGCMPVNFQRHNIDEIQRSEDNGYFCSEKTDGVRYLMVFTGKTVVLVDRSMKGKQPKPAAGQNPDEDPMVPVLPLIRPGTVLDGEVVMHRKLGRPIFIVFDVLALSTDQPILRLPFEERLNHLRRASFRTENCPRDMFAKEAVGDIKNVALPLVRKNFVKRVELDHLLKNVVEEKGVRVYRSGDVHNHMTDGIIFQPNLPYVCGTDVNLLKWKYLDTVTIDVEILPNDPYANRRSNLNNDDEDVLRVGVIAEEGTMVDMTRFIKLPPSERRRLEADRNENGAKIAEVGFDPTTGEWYYLTMRPDKIASNHISTVIGTLLELAECCDIDELRYRMSVPPGQRDTYRKEHRGMQRQLLGFQRQRNQQAAAAASSGKPKHHHSNGR